jgi:PA domain/Secretion system C-terminal sorting domain
MMKKLFTLCMTIFMVSLLNAQVVEFTVNGTPAYKGVQGITYVSAGGWGFNASTYLGQSWTSDIVMAKQAGVANDSIASFACDSLANGAAIKGKICLTRRGVCEFGMKAFQAQKAGAIGCIIANREPGAPVGMGAGAKGVDVNIPTVMISWELMQLIAADLKAGKAVNVTISVPAAYEPHIAYAYATPLKQTVPLDNIAMSVGNKTGKDATKFKSTVTVTEPDGKVVKIDTTYALLAKDSVTTLRFPSYTPTKKGKYSAVFTSPALTTKVLTREFQLNDSYYALDLGTVSGATGTTKLQFTNAGNEFHVGNIYVAGKNTNASHVSFALANPATMVGEEFSIVIYEVPEPLPATVTLGDLGIVPTKKNIFPQTVTITDKMKVNEQILVKLDEVVNLTEGKQYVVMIQYSGSLDTKIPQYTLAGNEDFNVLATFVYSANETGTGAVPTLFTGGFSGNARPTVRLHMANSVDANDLPKLAENEVSVFPVPASNELNVKFDFIEMSNNTDITVVDLMGRTVYSGKYPNIQNNTIKLNTTNYANGAYILYVKTDKKFDSRMFSIAK